MRVQFDPNFDGGTVLAWQQTPQFGVTATGPRGLLELLETALGLGGQHADTTTRLLALVRRLPEHEGFWSASAERDPFGTGRRLLNWYDTLSAWGWTGQVKHGRLGPLADVCGDLPLGMVGRLHIVNRALGDVQSPIECLTLYSGREVFAPLWRHTISCLERRGTKVVVAPAAAAAAPPDTNLGRIQRAMGTSANAALDPGCPSLVLYRPYGPVEAADATAAMAPTLGSSLIVIQGDSTLDDAFYRFGAPTMGTARASRTRAVAHSALHILPLLCELQFGSADPQRAAELLSLPESPVPARFRRALARVLDDVPSLRSAAFHECLATLLARNPDVAKREQVKSRLDTVLFASDATGAQQVRVAQLRSCVQITRELATAAYQRALRNDGLVDPTLEESAFDATEADDWRAVLWQCDTFERAFQALGGGTLSRPRVRQALELSLPPSVRSSFRDQVGTVSLARPGALASRAQTVLWWNFSREHIPAPTVVPLTDDEQSALRAANIGVVEPHVVSRHRAAQARRAVLHAGHRLILICPQFGADNERLHPHPLWDEISACVEHGSASLLQTETLFAASEAKQVSLRSLPKPWRDFEIGAGVVPEREAESPSSVSKYIGCELQHVLTYAARLRAGPSFELQLSPRVLGGAAHAILEHLGREGAYERNAGEEAAALFDEVIADHVAQLRDPARRGEYDELRSAVVDAAAHMARLVQNDGFTVHHVEEHVEGLLNEISLGGRPDVILKDAAGRLLVVDFKFGGESSRKDELRNGAAVQVAAYAQLLEKESEGPVAVAFYVLRNRSLLLSDAITALGTHIEGPSPKETWDAAAFTFAGRRAARGAGLVTARGVGEPDLVVRRSQLRQDRLELAPPCRYCDYAVLCGKAFAEGQA